jgi:hypothetical protein
MEPFGGLLPLTHPGLHPNSLDNMQLDLIAVCDFLA